MQDRKKLNKLVVSFIDIRNQEFSAKQIYHELKEENPQAFRENKVGSFKSFVRVMPTFKGIERVENSGECMTYKSKNCVLPVKKKGKFHGDW